MRYYDDKTIKNVSVKEMCCSDIIGLFRCKTIEQLYRFVSVVYYQNKK